MKPIIVIHGGALFEKSEHNKSHENQIKEILQQSLTQGYNYLGNDGAALDAVESAVKIMEDSGLFDAGRGSVYTSQGTQELDASIMDGSTRKAGAVTCVNRIKNPITAARMIMNQSKHVLMAGVGAEKFVEDTGGEMVDPSYFHCEREYEYYKRATKRGEAYKYHGTVGAVAIDFNGNTAAATSTGGLELQLPGRVGDAPVIGAGTYAGDDIGALSCTGSGEIFLRLMASHDVASRIRYGKQSMNDALDAVLIDIKELGGMGGIIAVDTHGNPYMPYNSEGMYRGFMSEEKSEIGIF